MEIYLKRTYEVFESYGPIEINVEEHPELEGKTDEEIISYLNEIMYEENIEGMSEGTLHDEFLFNTDIIKEKVMNEECEISL